MTKLNPIGTSYTIVLDASFDLHQAGYDNDYDSRNDFESAYRGAANSLADELGIDITVVSGTYDGPAMQKQTTHGDEGELWQAIHDRLQFDADEGWAF